MLDNKLFQVVKDVLNEDYIFEYPEDFKKRMIVQKTLYLLLFMDSLDTLNNIAMLINFPSFNTKKPSLINSLPFIWKLTLYLSLQ